MGLDELPQLLNIFRGEMSFVGPRSLAVGEIVRDEKGRVVQYEDILGFWERLRVRPGLTGLATICIPKDAFPRRKFRLFVITLPAGIEPARGLGRSTVSRFNGLYRR